jgi:hypothetical protein
MSAPLVEPTAPPWALRFALRLQQMFWPVFPTQPMRVWDAGVLADLPPAADWPDTVAVAGGAMWISVGGAWVLVGPTPAPTTSPTPPQFDNDTSIATTAFVQRALGSFANVVGLGANTALTAAQIGAYLIVFAAVTVTVPLNSSIGQPGAAFFIQNAAGGGVVTIARSGADTLFNPNVGSVTSFALAAGKSAWVVRGLSNDWYLSGTGV